jgi:hypothetical protein
MRPAPDGRNAAQRATSPDSGAAARSLERGFSHLFVDASTQSRPILERLGFAAPAQTTPLTHPGSAEQGSERRNDP